MLSSCTDLFHLGEICPKAVPLLVVGRNSVCVFQPRMSGIYNYRLSRWLSGLQQTQVLPLLRNCPLYQYCKALFNFWGMKNSKPLFLKCKNSNLNSLKVSAAGQDGLSKMASFEDKLQQENPILSDMLDWEPPSQTPVGFIHSHTVEVKNCSAV